MTHASALLGTWKIVSWTRTVVASGEVSDTLGPDPIGYISYQPDGRMMALVLNRQRPGLKGQTPADDEKAGLFDSMLAYAASYTLEEDRVIHHVDASWNPAWTGSDLSRPYRLDGDRLLISGAPSTDPVTGEAVIYHLEFTKV